LSCLLGTSSGVGLLLVVSLSSRTRLVGAPGAQFGSPQAGRLLLGSPPPGDAAALRGGSALDFT